jgi:hypothetical protein
MSREEIIAAGAQGPEPSTDYVKRLDMLDNVVRDCIQVSHGFGGLVAPSMKHFYASVLFTSLLGRAISLLMLAPHSPWAQKRIEHWDYASASVILRTMTELRAAFHYLCIDECSDDEWDCRWNLLNLHDCVSRIRLFEAMPADKGELPGLAAQAETLREKLRANRHFAQLRHQKNC